MSIKMPEMEIRIAKNINGMALIVPDLVCKVLHLYNFNVLMKLEFLYKGKLWM